MHGAVLLDLAYQVIRPAILWNDGRCFDEAEALADQPWIGQLAGAPPLTGFTAPKLMWVKRHEPDAYARIAHILLPKDYIGLRLHGRHVTDNSDAAGTLWLDQVRRDWSDALCEASSVDPAWLPDFIEGVDIAGHLTGDAAAALGLRAGLPVVAGGGDAATGAVSVGETAPGRAFISLGTSGQLFIATDAYQPNPDQVVHAYAHAVPGMWFQMAAMLNGACPLSWFAAIADAPIAELLAEAAEVEGKAPLFLPYLIGERTPHGDPHVRGAFLGLADGMGRAHLARAVVEGIAFTFADAADGLRAAGADLIEVSAIGGGAQSDLLLQTIANVAGLCIIRTKQTQTGAAAAPIIADRSFEPVRDNDLADRLARFRAAHPAIRAI